MNNGLSKKEKKAVSKLITKKLESMGIADEIKYVASGKKIKRPVFENNQIKVEDGKVVFEEIDVPVAMNVMRRTVRNLRNGPIEEIEAFLALQMPSSQSPESTESSTEVNTDGLTKE